MSVEHPRGQSLLRRVTVEGGNLTPREALQLMLYLYPDFLSNNKADYAIVMTEEDWEACRRAVKDALAWQEVIG